MSIVRMDTGGIVSRNLTVNIDARDGPFVNVYFVLEHQPDNCSQLPPSGSLIYSDIVVEFGGKRVTPTWEAHLQNPACDSKVSVLSPTSLQISWNINAATIANPNKTKHVVKSHEK
jgi:hypothetical protein